MVKKLLLLLVIFLYGCTTIDECYDTNPDLDPTQEIVVSVSTLGGDESTRISIDKDDDSGALNLSWSSEEILGGWTSGATTFSEFAMVDDSASDDASTALFKGEISSDQSYYRLFHPYTANAEISSNIYNIDFSAQSHDMNDGEYASIAKTLYMISPMISTSSGDSALLRHIGSMIELNLCFENLASDALLISSVEIEGAEGVELSQSAEVNLLQDVTDDDFISSQTNGAIKVNIVNSPELVEGTTYSVKIGLLPFVMAVDHELTITVKLGGSNEPATYTKSFTVANTTEQEINIARASYLTINKICDMSGVDMVSENWTDFAAESYAAGDGSADNPYQIATAEQFALLANRVDQMHDDKACSFVLTADINLGGKYWNPIGYDSETQHFNGIFDGGGYKISNMYISDTSSSCQGLFSYTDGATIRNVNLSGTAIVPSYSGGLVGYCTMSSIINCSIDVDVTGSGKYVGGVAGRVYQSSGSSLIELTISTGTVVSAGDAASTVGAIAGNVGGSGTTTVTSCYYLEQCATDTNGYTLSSHGTSMSSAALMSDDLVSTLNNIIALSNINNSGSMLQYWERESGGYPTLSSEEVTNDAFSAFFEGGSGWESDPYLIGSSSQLTFFGELVDEGAESICAKLVDDIILSEAWTPIGTAEIYGGVFDGDGYSITGLSVTGSESGLGLFGSITDATIKNLKVGGSVSSSTSYAAILVGKAWTSTIENCETLDGSSLTATSGDSHAGIVGYAYSCQITSCVNRADVVGVSCVGGILGYGNDNTDNTPIISCQNYGDIEGSTIVGGIVGTTNSSASLLINACENYGSVAATTSDYAGGIAARVYGQSGALSTIATCLNSGAISAKSSYCGGLVGGNQGGAIVNCYNNGDVSGEQYIGGLVGINEAYNSYAATIDIAYTTGAVSATSYGGAAVGKNNSSSLTSCYWLDEAYSVGVGDGDDTTTEFSSEQMMQDSFVVTLNSLTYYLVMKYSSLDISGWATSSKYPVFDREVVLSGVDITYNNGVYEIATDNGLRAFSDLINGYENSCGALCSGDASNFEFGVVHTSLNAILLSDIYLNGSEESQWSPIGVDSTNCYSGEFDGKNYTIYDIYVNGDTTRSGLFGHAKNATIQNVTVTGSITSSATYCGGIVGFATYETHIISCHNEAKVTSTYSSTGYVGGIVGGLYADSSTPGSVIGCTNSGKVTGYSYLGGIAGSALSFHIVSCCNFGSISYGAKIAGGICGIISNPSARISNCYNAGSITTDEEKNAGAIVGLISYSTVQVASCYYDNAISGVAWNLSGNLSSTPTVLEAMAVPSTLFTDAYFVKMLNNDAYEYNETSPSYAAYGWETGSSSYPESSSSIAPTYTDISTQWAGAGTSSNPYLVMYASHLHLMASTVNGGNRYDRKYFTQICDIDLNNESFAGIGNYSNDFVGYYNGGNYTVSGLNVNSGGETCKGLFGHIYYGWVKNLTVKGSVTGSNYTGGVVGRCYNASISNCHSEVTVKGTGKGVGGVLGYMHGTSSTNSTCYLSNCSNSGSVTSTSSDGCVGGIVGLAYEQGCNINTSYNSGKVTGTTSVGGVVGKTYADTNYVLESYMTQIGNCYNTGTVSGTSNVGGIIGEAYWTGLMQYCYNSGSVSGTTYVGGIGGYYYSAIGRYCYYLSGTANDAFGYSNMAMTDVTSKSSSEMQSSSFTLFDSSSWVYNSGGYPTLSWQ
ncbi:MAG: GLUG motif-containing protein [Rikenellaceae bacterium]